MIWQAMFRRQNRILKREEKRVINKTSWEINDDITLRNIFGSMVVHKYKTEFLNKAIYGQVSHDILDEWRATLGLRYTEDSTKGNGYRYKYAFNNDTTPLPVVISPTTPEVDSKKPTGMFELSYRNKQI